MTEEENKIKNHIFDLISNNEGKNWEAIFPDILKDMEGHETPHQYCSSEYKDIIGSFPMHNNIPIVFCKQCNKPVLINHIKQHETLCIDTLSTKTINIEKFNELQINTVVCSNEYITITDEQIDKKRTEIQNAFHLSVHLNEEQKKTEQPSQQETNPLIYKFSEAKPLPLSLTSHKTKRTTNVFLNVPH